jgi:hypothetical protein
MKWAAILSVLSMLASALWRPALSFLAALRMRRMNDLGNANEIRRRAQVAGEKHRETVTRIDDDTLDRRLRELRGSPPAGDRPSGPRTS